MPAERIKPQKQSSLSVNTIQHHLCHYFGGPRKQIVVPNVSWGLLNHECDLVVCTKAGYLTEVEIKRSYADFVADFKKQHRHDDDNRIKHFYYAVPEFILSKVMTFLNDKSESDKSFKFPAVLSYDEYGRISAVKESGSSENWGAGKSARALTQEEMLHLAHLGSMRIFTMLEKLEQANTKIKELKSRLSNGMTDSKIIETELIELHKEADDLSLEMTDIHKKLRYEDVDDAESKTMNDSYDYLDRRRSAIFKQIEFLSNLKSKFASDK